MSFYSLYVKKRALRKVRKNLSSRMKLVFLFQRIVLPIMYYATDQFQVLPETFTSCSVHLCLQNIVIIILSKYVTHAVKNLRIIRWKTILERLGSARIFYKTFPRFSPTYFVRRKARESLNYKKLVLDVLILFSL